MHIILLAGGSGERLWPLSSDKTPKPFLEILEGEDGKRESMLQRVCRLIKKTGAGADVTVSTDREHLGLVRKQLGEDVSVCVEPSRRDTFAAVSLACEYLKCEKCASDGDAVAVCPVDAYADEDFYEAVCGLEREVLKGGDGITLLGIKPDHASGKYGYIVPGGPFGPSDAVEFREKPDETEAEHFVEIGGLWNAGVFAFRLGYMLEKIREKTGFTDYEGLYAGYDGVEKTSFDYAVLEKERNLRVVKFSGVWCDIGSWEDLAHVMPEKTSGNVVMDENCSGSYVLNETGVPILCMGLKNFIVVATENGILIMDTLSEETDGERGGNMKECVEKILDGKKDE
ncbi:MAG: NTP transferase domain-containing protein [Clostridia bacterium]|nr:NTP transferase domain-containing protein [Clostridia bacterium]